MSIKIYVKYVKNNRDFHTTKLNLPTGALDGETAGEIMGLLKSLKQQGKTIIVVTHDEKVASYCDYVIQIKKGKIVR